MKYKTRNLRVQGIGKKVLINNKNNEKNVKSEHKNEKVYDFSIHIYSERYKFMCTYI